MCVCVCVCVCVRACVYLSVYVPVSVHAQSDLTYPHTSVLDEIVNKVGEQ